jgi:hypothetical protein
MKKIIILLILATVSFSAFSQTMNSEEQLRAEMRFQENVSTVFIQLVADESVQTDFVKIRLVLGNDNVFYQKNKGDFEVYVQINAEVPSFNNLPDALNYLRDKGFKIESYSTTYFQENVRHNLLLSRTVIK